MDQMNHTNRCLTLLEISEWMSKHPDVNIDSINLMEDPIRVDTFSLNSRTQAQHFVHAVGGKVDKAAEYGLVTLQHRPKGANFVVRAIFNQTALCTSRVVGTKMVRTATQWEDKEQDILEWDCAPIMKEAHE